MKAKLIVEGREMNIDLSTEEIRALTDKQTNKTGYEYIGVNQGPYWYTTELGYAIMDENKPCSDNCDECYVADGDLCYHPETLDRLYDVANYYSNPDVAANNARADNLMRQLRRFAVEHRFEEVCWDNDRQWKHYIAFCYGSLAICHCDDTRALGVIYFDSIEIAYEAMKIFHDELIWYFTEYKDSL